MKIRKILWLFLLGAVEDLAGDGRVGCVRCWSFGAAQVLPDKNRNCQPLQGVQIQQDGMVPSHRAGGSRLCCPPQSWQDVVPGVTALSQGKRSTPGLSSWTASPAPATGAAPAPSAPRTLLPAFGRGRWSPCCASRSLLGMSPGKEPVLGRISPCSPQGGAWSCGHSWPWSWAGPPGLHPGAGGGAWSLWERGSPA